MGGLENEESRTKANPVRGGVPLMLTIQAERPCADSRERVNRFSKRPVHEDGGTRSRRPSRYCGGEGENKWEALSKLGS
jgi:hypothetical protein